MQHNLILIEVEGGSVVQPCTDLVGDTDTITIDWDYIGMSGSTSLDEAMIAIARYKAALYPWQDKAPDVWQQLLKTEGEWLEGAESDARLTYQ